VSDDVVLPRWRWDTRRHLLMPTCPRCESSLIVSGSKMTCHMVGHSHFDEKLDDVLTITQRRLTTEP
jgi:hypothetical protein